MQLLGWTRIKKNLVRADLPGNLKTEGQGLKVTVNVHFPNKKYNWTRPWYLSCQVWPSGRRVCAILLPWLLSLQYVHSRSVVSPSFEALPIGGKTFDSVFSMAWLISSFPFKISNGVKQEDMQRSADVQQLLNGNQIRPLVRLFTGLHEILQVLVRVFNLKK